MTFGMTVLEQIFTGHEQHAKWAFWTRKKTAGAVAFFLLFSFLQQEAKGRSETRLIPIGREREQERRSRKLSLVGLRDQASTEERRPVSSRTLSSVCFNNLRTNFSKSFLDFSSSSRHCFIRLFSCSRGEKKGSRLHGLLKRSPIFLP